VTRAPVDPRAFLPLTPLAFQVLLALADTDRHGYGIILEVGERTDGLITLRTGTLYTLLQRLMDDALIEPVDAPAAREQRGAEGRVEESPPIKAREQRGAEGFPQASGPGGVQGAPPIKARERRGAEGSPQASGPGGVQGAPPIKNDQRRKYYGLTALGREVLSAEARRLESVLSDARRKRVIKRA
jgi:DNA-binding PadR family transcriptional regulator